MKNVTKTCGYVAGEYRKLLNELERLTVDVDNADSAEQLRKLSYLHGQLSIKVSHFTESVGEEFSRLLAYRLYDLLDKAKIYFDYLTAQVQKSPWEKGPLWIIGAPPADAKLGETFLIIQSSGSCAFCVVQVRKNSSSELVFATSAEGEIVHPELIKAHVPLLGQMIPEEE
jgi:hypothetical protein